MDENSEKKEKKLSFWQKSEVEDDVFTSTKEDEMDDMIEIVDLPEAISDVPTAEAEALEDVPEDLNENEEGRRARFFAVLRQKHREEGGRKKKEGNFFLRALKALLSFFYEVGYYTEYAGVIVGRFLFRAFILMGEKLLIVLRFLVDAVLFIPKMLVLLLVRPIWHLISAGKNVSDIWYSRDPDEVGGTWKATFRYLGGGIRRHAHLLLDLLSWLVPIAAAGVFIFTVQSVMNNQYVLAVSYGDQMIGYVQSEDVCDTAQQDVQSRIIYTDDNTEEWSVQPQYTLAINDGLNLMNSDDVADAILQSSGQEIIEATGLYKDGIFYGATEDRARLVSDLEAIKAPYVTGEEGETVGFVDEPSLVDGVYLASSLVNYSEISSLINGQVAGEVNYEVQQGDTPSGIANEHGLTTAELYAMNPELEDGGMYPGDNLVISQAVPFLQVQVSYRRTETESVPYDTVRTNTADLAFGFTKVATEGVDGVNEVVYDYVYIDGVLVSKTLVSTTVVSAPVTEEILVGTTVKAGVTMVPATGGFMWPIPGYTYVSRGFTGLYAHNGMDICASYGTPIYAAQSGVVTRALYTNVGYGIYLIIDHGNGYSTLYGHCSGLAVSAGSIVNQGDLIAYIGSTGNSTGNHCHFEIRINNTQVNPAPYVGYG